MTCGRSARALWAALVSIVAHQPAAPDEYKAGISSELGLAHVSIETHVCPADACDGHPQRTSRAAV